MDARSITVVPAFHRCDQNPSKNYGICDARMIWTLRDGADAITWELFTGWGMPDDAFHAANPACSHARHQGSWPSAPAMGGAVDWHMANPTTVDEAGGDCSVLSGRCYSDFGFLVGDELFDLLRTEGDEAVWERLLTLLTEYRTDTALATLSPSGE